MAWLGAAGNGRHGGERTGKERRGMDGRGRQGAGGETGKRKGLKIPRRKACGFDSRPAHHSGGK